jgi:glycine/D-amino acid oxidase-like deaminating enzyme/nitrite reductase/ring-hydroxylating ferredoxin subunit
MKNNTSSVSVWQATVEMKKFSPLTQNTNAEICVVGAGITGLMCAYFLAKEGKNVVVIDDGEIGGGETCKTTAHITNVIDDRYYEVERLFGRETAKLACESETEAINAIERIIQEENIDCDFRRLDGYLFFTPDEKADVLQKEYESCVLAGLDVVIEAKAPIDSFGNYPCLRFPNQAQFNPLKFLNGLCDAILKYGGKIYTGSHAESVEDGEQNAKVILSSKVEITAGDVVVATNSPISDYVKMHLKQAPYMTYVIGFTVPENYIEDGLYWDDAEPYHYIRKYFDGEDDILIIGGEDTKTGQEENPDERFECLEQWANEHFPMIDLVKYKWSGQVMEPVDALSFIGKDPEMENHVYISTGDSGMGMTHAAISGMLLRDLILGRENKWAEIYDPKRVTLSAANEFIKEGANAVSQYVDYITPGDKSSIDDIKNDDGAIIRDGLSKMAVYRDEDGRVFKYSAVCTHLKCIVQWNSEEKTWDCPCHGSRFDKYGVVINGPALTNLEKIEE